MLHHRIMVHALKHATHHSFLQMYKMLSFKTSLAKNKEGAKVTTHTVYYTNTFLPMRSAWTAAQETC